MSRSPNPGHCGASESFALRVMDDDMAPEFRDGHIIIVGPGGCVSMGCYVIVNYRDEVIFRQLRIDGDSWVLQALDSRIADIPLANGCADIVGDFDNTPHWHLVD